jgi:hypothetical protein
VFISPVRQPHSPRCLPPIQSCCFGGKKDAPKTL